MSRFCKCNLKNWNLKEAVKLKDFDKAERFLIKSIKLNPTDDS